MTATVTALPSRPRPARQQLAAQLVGAVLCLGADVALFEAMGIPAEAFEATRLHKQAWQIAWNRAKGRAPVSVATVASAGLRTPGWFNEADVAELEALAAANVLSKQELLRVAEDFRELMQRDALRLSLAAEIQALDSGRPVRSTATRLEALAAGVQRDTAPDEDAAGDVVDLADEWAHAEVTGKSRLLPTGIKVIDDEIGGFPPGVTVILAAGGVGKTKLMDSSILEVLRRDPSAHLGGFLIEDGSQHVAKRFVSQYTGIPLREVGWRKRTPEEMEKTQEAFGIVTPLLQRLHVYRHDTVHAAALVQRMTAMRLKHKVEGIFVDNLTEIDVSDSQSREKGFERIAELLRRVRNFGLREKIPVVVLAHTVGTVRDGEIPEINDIAGGQNTGRRARLVLALWNRDGQLRCTIGKANELGAKGTTVELESYASAALVNPTGGFKVNVNAERAAKRDAEALRKIDESMKLAAYRASQKSKLKKAGETPVTVKPEDAQAALFDAEKQAAVEKPEGWKQRWGTGAPKENE